MQGCDSWEPGQGNTYLTSQCGPLVAQSWACMLGILRGPSSEAAGAYAVFVRVYVIFLHQNMLGSKNHKLYSHQSWSRSTNSVIRLMQEKWPMLPIGGAITRNARFLLISLELQEIILLKVPTLFHEEFNIKTWDRVFHTCTWTLMSYPKVSSNLNLSTSGHSKLSNQYLQLNMTYIHNVFC